MVAQKNFPAAIDPFASPRSQQFSLPENIIYYVAKNPKFLNEYQKLTKTCKYFFVTNPIIATKTFNNRGNECKIINYKISEVSLSPVKFLESSYKLWITKNLFIEKFVPFQKFIFNSSTNLNYLSFQKTRLSFNELLFLSEIKIKRIEFEEAEIKYEDGSIVTVEKIFSVFSNIISFEFIYMPNSYFTSNSAKEIVKCKHFKTLESFSMNLIPEIFDCETFFKAIVQRPKMRITIKFADSISNDYKQLIRTSYNAAIIHLSEKQRNDLFWNHFLCSFVISQTNRAYAGDLTNIDIDESSLMTYLSDGNTRDAASMARFAYPVLQFFNMHLCRNVQNMRLDEKEAAALMCLLLINQVKSKHMEHYKHQIFKELGEHYRNYEVDASVRLANIVLIISTFDEALGKAKEFLTCWNLFSFKF